MIAWHARLRWLMAVLEMQLIWCRRELVKLALRLPRV